MPLMWTIVLHCHASLLETKNILINLAGFEYILLHKVRNVNHIPNLLGTIEKYEIS